MIDRLMQTMHREECRRRYRADDVRTFRGAVMTIVRTGACVQLTLRTQGRSVEVHLGPRWYMKECGLKLAPGDPLEVRGSMIEGESGDVLIASELRKRGQSFAVRSAAGFPLWSRE